jgi:hypothetical protein
MLPLTIIQPHSHCSFPPASSLASSSAYICPPSMPAVLGPAMPWTQQRGLPPPALQCSAPALCTSVGKYERLPSTACTLQGLDTRVLTLPSQLCPLWGLKGRYVSPPSCHADHFSNPASRKRQNKPSVVKTEQEWFFPLNGVSTVDKAWLGITRTQTHMHTHRCTHAHTCTYRHMHTHMHADTCAYTYTETHACTHVHTCTQTHVHTCTHMHTCTHRHTSIHAHTGTQVLASRSKGRLYVVTLTVPCVHNTCCLGGSCWSGASSQMSWNPKNFYISAEDREALWIC